jgi:exonuclease SbcD
MMAHLLFMPEGGEEPEEPEDERPINHIGGARPIYSSAIPPAIQYVALGHLHRNQFVFWANGPVVYSGSPLAYSFAESGQQKQVVIADLEPGKKAVFHNKALQQGRKLERKRFESLAEAESWLTLNQSALVELTLATENFLSGEDRRRLHEIHDGIVTIIPEILSSESNEMDVRKDSPVLESMPDLFMEYFRNKKGQEADEVIMNLFREINAEEEEL